MSETLLVSALEESIEILQDELTRCRRVNKILRTVNRRLRLMVTIAHSNDEAFKDFALSEITDVEDDGWITRSGPSRSDGI